MPRKLSEEQLLKRRIRQAKRSFSDFYDKRSVAKVLYALSSVEADLKANIEQVDPRLMAQLWPGGYPDNFSGVELAYLAAVTPELSDELHRYDPSLIYSIIGMELVRKAEESMLNEKLDLVEQNISEAEAVVGQLTGEGKANKPNFWMTRQANEDKQKLRTSISRRQSVEKSAPYAEAQRKKERVDKYVESVRELLISNAIPSDDEILQKYAVNALDRLTLDNQSIQKLNPFEKELNALISALDEAFDFELSRDYLYKNVKKYLEN